MHWKRFVFAFRDAVCAELVTALERYLASDYWSQPYPLGMVSCVGRGTWGGGWGGRGAWNEKGNRWQDSAWKPVPPPDHPRSAVCRTFCSGRAGDGRPAPRTPLPQRSPHGTGTPGQAWKRAALGKGEQVSGFRKVPGEVFQQNDLICVFKEIMSHLQFSPPPPFLPPAIRADTEDQEGSEHKAFQQTRETMLSLLLPGANIDLKTWAAARKKKQ